MKRHFYKTCSVVETTIRTVSAHVSSTVLLDAAQKKVDVNLLNTVSMETYPVPIYFLLNRTRGRKDRSIVSDILWRAIWTSLLATCGFWLLVRGSKYMIYFRDFLFFKQINAKRSHDRDYNAPWCALILILIFWLAFMCCEMFWVYITIKLNISYIYIYIYI